MNNNPLVESLALAWKNKKIRYTAIIGVLALVGIVVAILIMQPQTLTTTKLNLTTGSQVSLVDNKIAAYNGTSFFTIDPQSNKGITNIHTPPFRLPEVSHAVWANNDQGVLLNFKSGIHYSPVQDYFTQNNLDLITSNYLTWYLDFTDNSLHFVDSYTIANTFAVYSPSDNGFYYIPNLNQDDGKNSLRFFDIKSRTTKDIVKDLDLNVTSMNTCDINQAILCIIGRISGTPFGKTSIFSVSKEGKVTTEVRHTGEIYPTPIKNTYALLSEGTQYQEVDTIYSKITIRDINTGTSTAYTGNVFAGNTLIGLFNSQLYLLDGRNNEYLLLHSKDSTDSTSIGQLSVSDDSELKDGIIIMDSQGNSDMSLIGSLDGNLHIVSGKSLPYTFTKRPVAEVEATVTQCANSVSGSTERTDDSFVVYVNDGTFKESLAKVKQCIANDSGNLFGYTYSYRGVDSFNGRVSTD